MTTDASVRPLLAVKQAIPPVRDGAVPRERLTSELGSARTRLTVVVAPAGWGKTSALSAWAADPGDDVRVAWVSLDESDDEPRQFWSYVLTALDRASESISAEPWKALGPADVSVLDLALPTLLNELAATSTRHVLVLDDFHVVTDARILEAVEFLVTFLPPSLRLVVAGRTDPQLPLARLRGRGDLAELRAADLRFSADEAAALLTNISGRDLEVQDGASVWERTEGWAAGLQLAALAMRTDPNGVRGRDRHLLDYFAEEVIPSLAPRQRDLLVRAAPLELLSGPLCDAALELAGSADVLDDLVRADLFVAALDGEQRWYRCHQIMRDALLKETGADRAGVLSRAAAWFESQGRMDDAVRHRLLAGDREAAAGLLLRTAESWFFPRGAAATYLQLGEQLATLALDSATALSFAYAGALSGQLGRVNHWLDVAEAAITPETTIPRWNSPLGATLCFRATFGMSDADSAGSVALAQRAVELETAGGGTPNPTVVPALGGALVRDGRFADGVEVLQELWDRERTRWAPWIVLQAASALLLGLSELERGEGADRVLRQVLPLVDDVEQDWGDAAAVLATVRLVEGRRRHLQGDAGEGVALLRRAVELAERHPRPMVAVVGLVYLADAELAAGDRVAAQAALQKAREIVDEEPVAPFAVQGLESAEVRIGRGSARAARRSGDMFEALTDRELSILRALQGTASQREIGAALFLSVNTVKAYNKILYRKLGVASRQDAVTVGRELGLI